mmetsp:Transcript_13458/g.39706  ORF Transcript_13458/g.39706 Transcript_13458/m.39706 type:complete len:201 (+) Transcript_13458:412-1014(+)
MTRSSAACGARSTSPCSCAGTTAAPAGVSTARIAVPTFPSSPASSTAQSLSGFASGASSPCCPCSGSSCSASARRHATATTGSPPSMPQRLGQCARRSPRPPPRSQSSRACRTAASRSGCCSRPRAWPSSPCSRVASFGRGSLAQGSSSRATPRPEPGARPQLLGRLGAASASRPGANSIRLCSSSTRTPRSTPSAARAT